MNSETSTEPSATRPAFEAWQLFTLAGLIGAAIVAFRAGAQPPSARIFLIVTIFAAAAIGLAVLRTFGPLAGAQSRDARTTLGDRTRQLLEREKMLALRVIKELEFDHAMGKVSGRDYEEMGARLRARASRILRQLDESAGTTYRTTIEQEVARRVGEFAGAEAPAHSLEASAGAEALAHTDAPVPSFRACEACAVANDVDARFCKACGARLETV
jgi:hypothetical protein